MRLAARLAPSLATLCVLPSLAAAQAADAGLPRLAAVRATTPVRLDGVLDEEAWSSAPLATGFRQVEPDHGSPARLDTEVRVVFDDEALYIGAFCHDPAGAAGVRVQDLRRDFDNDNNDTLSLAFDPWGDGRIALSFQVTPYGSQRDQRVFDDAIFDVPWDAIWRVETRRGALGWTAEVAIPWRTLSYDPRATTWRFQVRRMATRINELTGWAPWPRNVNHYRMTHAGFLDGLAPPTASRNLLLRPYALGRVIRGADGELDLDGTLGGELRWAITPTTTLDLTLNTDFAEADVDQLQINLRRYSLFVPERRQFFLDNAGLFAPALETEALMPWFTRRIGLADGRAVPILGGARLISQSAERSIGAMAVATAEVDDVAPAGAFAIARYTHNLGDESRVGGLVIARHDRPLEGSAPMTNVVPALDGLARQGRFTLRGFAALSSTTVGDEHSLGGGGAVAAELQTDRVTAKVTEVVVTDRFEAAAGFVPRKDVLITNPEATFDLRPRWRPGWLRAYRAFASANVVQRLSDRGLIEAMVHVEPTWLVFESGDEVWFYVEQSWQEADEAFEPVPGAAFPAGSYSDLRATANLWTNRSRAYSLEAYLSYGSFYGARLATATAVAALRPIPHLALVAQHEVDAFSDLPGGGSLTNHLTNLELRLAANPRLQLVGTFQHDRLRSLTLGKVRASWEFQPLSWIYLIYQHDPEQDQLLAKLTWSWQL